MFLDIHLKYKRVRSSNEAWKNVKENNETIVRKWKEILNYFTFRLKHRWPSSKMYRRCRLKKHNESSNDLLIPLFLLNEQVKSTRPKKKRWMALHRKDTSATKKLTAVFILTLIRQRLATYLLLFLINRL